MVAALALCAVASTALPAGADVATDSGTTAAAHGAAAGPSRSLTVSAHMVPGVTGPAAANLVTPAQRTRYMNAHYARLRHQTTASAKASANPSDVPPNGHQFWAVYPQGGGAPTGMYANHTVLPDLRTSHSGDVVYAPTMYPAGNACIEDTTAYMNNQAVIWAWDWCGSYTVGKYTVMDSSFQNTYVSNGAYGVLIVQTDAGSNTWQMQLYNFTTGQWDPYFTSSGRDTNNPFGANVFGPFGWDAFEVYSPADPSTGQPYICADTAGRSFTASDIQQLEGSNWTSLSSADSTVDGSGTIFSCPNLNANFTTPYSAWTVSNS